MALPGPLPGQGQRPRDRTPDRATQRGYRPIIGTAFLHTVVDDHSRVAYVEICADEKAETAVGVLQRAVVWFADTRCHRRARALRQRRLLPLLRLARHLRCTRHQPQTHPPLPAPDQRQDANASTAPSPTAGPTPASTTQKTERRAALPAWLHFYNHHRIHSAIGGTPTSRLNNLPGHTAPWATVGPTPASTPQNTSAEQPCPDGSTSTIITGSTPRSAAHPSTGSTTCLDITSSRPRRAHPRPRTPRRPRSAGLPAGPRAGGR